MSITVNDLDTEVSSRVQDAMRSELYYRLRTLPMDSEIDKIKAVVDGEFKNTLDDIVAGYYRSLMERDVEFNLSIDDYINVYLGRI